MDGIGSDIAVDDVAIALVDDEAKKLSRLIVLSKRMIGTIELNMTFTMLNFIAIDLAITGVLNLAIGALYIMQAQYL